MIPVVVFAYNRPDLLCKLLDCLRAEEIPTLFAFSDGPKTVADISLVAKVRSLLHEIDWCECHIEERDGNLGLGRSVKFGVTAVLARHEAVLVFEDDLIFVPGTYRYLVAALRHFHDDPRVMSVAGWTHPRVIPAGLGDAPYFDGKAECWGWGTWRRSWAGMEEPAMSIMQHCVEKGIDICRYGSDMPKMAAEAERRNLWAIGWWYLHLLRGGLCLRPPSSLVESTGWDGRGVTVTPAMIEWSNPPLAPCPPVPDVWPRPVEHPDCPRLWKAAVGDPMDR